MYTDACLPCTKFEITTECLCEEGICLDIEDDNIYLVKLTGSCNCNVTYISKKPPRVQNRNDASCSWTFSSFLCFPDNATVTTKSNLLLTTLTTGAVPQKTEATTEKTSITTGVTTSTITIGEATDTTQTISMTVTTTDINSTITGFWIWAVVFRVFTVAALMKLILQLRKQQNQYVPLLRSLTSTTNSHLYSQTMQSSYLSMESSQTPSAQGNISTPEPFNPNIYTQTQSSSPKHDTLPSPPPAFHINDQEESPEPYASPIDQKKKDHVRGN
ncbi:unnamed protein product [Mytilus coruscus]|uniref:Uncharacterized protein n=1 Tax=Mytilus coruscus TaxID=42192 RepID=A0A6J8E048_MYTCO|nr:unnamed protein product [Mytilus coruscus]